MIEGAGKVDQIIVGLVLAIDLVSVATLFCRLGGDIARGDMEFAGRFPRAVTGHLAGGHMLVIAIVMLAIMLVFVIAVLFSGVIASSADGTQRSCTYQNFLGIHILAAAQCQTGGQPHYHQGIEQKSCN